MIIWDLYLSTLDAIAWPHMVAMLLFAEDLLSPDVFATIDFQVNTLCLEIPLLTERDDRAATFIGAARRSYRFLAFGEILD